MCGPAAFLLPGVPAGLGVSLALGVGLAWVCGPAPGLTAASCVAFCSHPEMAKTTAATTTAAPAKTQTYFLVLIGLC